MTATADVIIIGGGIAGASIAYHLLQKQPGLQVTLLERNSTCGEGSTGKATGGIRCQFATRINVELTKMGLPLYRNFEAVTGQAIGFREHGYLFVTADPAKVPSMQRNLAMQQEAGVPSQRVSPEECRELFPQLRTDDLIGGTFCPWDASAAPLDAMQGFLSRARERGLQLKLEHEVTDLLVSGGRVTGVRTSQGDFHAGAIINACGPWAARVAKMAGLELRAQPYRRQVFIAPEVPVLGRGLPLTVDLDTGWYIHQEKSGSLLLGGTDKDTTPGFEEKVDWWNGLPPVLEAGVKRVPVLVEAQVSRAYAGLRTLTPDFHAILGEVPGIGGFYLANGFSGHGFMHAPAVGQLLAEIVLDGHATSLDISPLAIGRFANLKQGEDLSMF
jgi:sarcosine oxidase subunit beta